MGNVKVITVISILAVGFVSFSLIPVFAPSHPEYIGYEIPSWVKGVAGFWAEDKISDQDFGEGLTFLIEQGIIKIPKIIELENQVAQLEAEIASLKNQGGGIQSPEDCGPNQVFQLGKCRDIVDYTTPITVSTDMLSYNDGDLIVISGNVGVISETFPDAPVTIILTGPTGNIGGISSILPSSNGSFSHTLIAGGTMNESGVYLISAKYGTHEASTTFSFISSGFTPPPPIPLPEPEPEP